MNIKRLYIGSMGIYKNALMEDISSKIVVIGGLNRAGKTTLLEVLRHMAYGFSKNLRNDKTEYYVESDLIYENKTYNLKVSGLKEPQLTPLNSNKNVSLKEVYGNIDSFTYSNLYTITLDELKKSQNKDYDERLQAVLIGAGLKDIVHIPKIIEEFRKEKEKIGGKLGSPNTKLFKNHYEKILETLESREEALKEVDEYKESFCKLNLKEEEIKLCEEKINKIQNRLLILEVLKADFNDYREKTALEMELKSYNHGEDFERFKSFPSIEKIEMLYEDYKKLWDEYADIKGKISTAVNYKDILKEKNNIINFEKQESGISQQINNYLFIKEKYERDKEEIIKKMNYLNPLWQGDLIKVLNINFDYIEEDKLVSIIDDISKAEELQRKIQWEIESLNSQKDIMGKEIKSSNSKDLGIFIKKYLYISLGIIFTGMIIFLFNKPLGSSLSIVGAAVSALYLFIKYSSKDSLVKREGDLYFQLKTIDNSIESNNLKLESIKENINDFYIKIEPYKKMLQLNKDISLSGLYDYFKQVKELKNKIISLGYMGKNLDALLRDINAELKCVKDLVVMLYNDNLSYSNNISKYCSELFSRIEFLSNELRKAEKLSDTRIKFMELQNKIEGLLTLDKNKENLLQVLEEIIENYKVYNYYNGLQFKLEIINNQIGKSMKNERLIQALNNDYGEINESIEKYFDKLYNNYSSLDEIEKENFVYENKLKECIMDMDELKEEKNKLKIHISSLRTSEKLEKAQSILDEERGKLRNLAVKFSVYSAAEYILDKVQKNFIEKAKDSLLSGAGSIFSEITKGEYKAILPQDNLLEADFRIKTNEGEALSSVDMLSKGTGEQLYLSVRLNRIKEIKAKLPIILDDALVNFDIGHAENALNIISKLGEDNQIFILTCHSEMLKLINSIREDVQYWKLDKGRFQLSNYDDLVNYLSKG